MQKNPGLWLTAGQLGLMGKSGGLHWAWAAIQAGWRGWAAIRAGLNVLPKTVEEGLAEGGQLGKKLLAGGPMLEAELTYQSGLKKVFELL